MSIRESNGRRQPTRAVRSSAARPLNYYARPFGYRASNTMIAEPDPPSNEAPGFYPAITFFTDGLAALPKETMRQFTLLKETEGKAYQPDHSISDLLDAFNSLPPAPRQRLEQPSSSYFGLSMNNSVSGSANASVVDGSIPLGSQLIPETLQLDEHAEHRAAIYREMQMKLREMTMVLDEKNMVLANANETINRQLERLDSAMPYIEEEISEEARLGSNTHWALPHMKDTKRTNGVAPERVRRDAHNVTNLAHAAVAVENDAAASRSEARREAIAAKRSRAHHIDSDFDTERPVAKKAHTAKPKKTQDERVDSRAAPSAQKRRRADKPAGASMERTMSAATNGRTAPGREVQRDVPTAEPRKKKSLPAPPTAKKRPGANSPSVASSPTRGGFGPAHRDNSPGGASMQRGASSRGRQNSALSGLAEQSRGRPGSAHAQQRAANGLATDKGEARNALLNSQRKAQNGIDHTGDVQSDAATRKASEAGAEPAKAPDLMKREETEPTAEAESSAAANARSRGSSRPSKPGTPVAGASTESTTTATTAATAAPAAATAASTGMSRSRSTRGATNLNTSASAAPSPQVQPLTSPRKGGKKSNPSRKSSISSLDAGEGLEADGTAENDGEEGEGNDDNEPTYCKCGGVSYGSMVACDNENCPREWFHLECVGLKRMPGHKDKWYCSNECREEARGAAATGR